MKIGIFGCGAVGFAMASFIYENDSDKVFICAKDKYLDRIKNGIVVNDKKYLIKHTSSDVMDYLFIAVKNYDLEKSFEDIKNFINKKTVIIPILNGICAHDVLHKEFVLNKVLYGMIKIEANMREDYSVITSNVYTLALGEKYNVDTPEYLKPLIDVLSRANINYKVFDDMQREVWMKWMLNIGINQISALTNSNYNELRHPYLKEIMLNLFLEITSLAKVCGVNIVQKDAYDLIDYIESKASNRYTSMAMDFKNRKKNELEYFSGYALKLAKEHKISLPTNEMIYKLLKAISDNFGK